MERVRNLIVGAGVSGLAAAAFSRDPDYLVLEADSAIGGYCKTVKQDGFSWELLLSDLEKAYKSGSLPPALRQYSEWASGQRKAIESGDLTVERGFWQKELSAKFPNR